MPPAYESPSKASTGIAGLDAVLDGGFPLHRIYLVEGESGTGKTTLGLQFLLNGLAKGERVVYVALSESIEELHASARSHGWSLDGMQIHEFTSGQAAEWLAAEQTIFPTSEVELEELTGQILQSIQTIRPDRVVLDSVEEVRLLAETPLRYRRHILGLRQTLTESGATVLMLDTARGSRDGTGLSSLVHGVLKLEQMPLEYGGVRRRLHISKMRGMPFHEGYHDFRICTGGLAVYPRTVVTEEDGPKKHLIESGLSELDMLLGGGLRTGTACLIIGQTGTGKTTLALIYAYRVARDGGKVAIFLFDERLDTLYTRMRGMSMDLSPLVESGHISIRQINTGEVSPGEFASFVRSAVEEESVDLILIDSLTGYISAMPQETRLLSQMHDLLAYLGQRGILTLLTLTQHGLLATERGDSIDLSYLADTVLLLRHFEANGTLRKAISVVKKRYGDHERTIREMNLGATGVRVGDPLTAFTGVLTGHPTFVGSQKALFDLEDRDEKDSGRGAIT